MRRIVSGHMTRHSMHDKESHDITLGSSSPVHPFLGRKRPTSQQFASVTESNGSHRENPFLNIFFHGAYGSCSRPQDGDFVSRCSLVALIRPHCPCFSFRWFVYIWPPTYGPDVIVMARSLSKGPANACASSNQTCTASSSEFNLENDNRNRPAQCGRVVWYWSTGRQWIRCCRLFFPQPRKRTYINVL